MDTYKSNFVNVNGIRLHYLDWGGDGPVLLFLAGMGCSAYIYSQFAPRFTDHFHVLAVTRRGHGDSDYPETGYNVETLTEDLHQFLDVLGIKQVILVGHSMANLELCHFAVLYPQRVLKLVFLDAAYDRTKFAEMRRKSPFPQFPPPDTASDFDTLEAMIAHTKRFRPDLAAIWGAAVEEDFRHSVETTSEGKIVDKMSDSVGSSLMESIFGYVPEDTRLQAPVLSFYAILDGPAYMTPEYLTPEKRALVLDYIRNIQLPVQRESIERFRRDVPHARIIEIPQGHHMCFIKDEELVFAEMRKFLLEP